jgi:hypothetical protein
MWLTIRPGMQSSIARNQVFRAQFRHAAVVALDFVTTEHSARRFRAAGRASQ